MIILQMKLPEECGLISDSEDLTLFVASKRIISGKGE